MGVHRQFLGKKQVENTNKAIMMKKVLILFSLLVAVIIAGDTTAKPDGTTTAADETTAAADGSTAAADETTAAADDPTTTADNSSSSVVASWLLVASMILYNCFTLDKN